MYTWPRRWISADLMTSVPIAVTGFVAVTRRMPMPSLTTSGPTGGGTKERITARTVITSLAYACAGTWSARGKPFAAAGAAVRSQTHTMATAMELMRFTQRLHRTAGRGSGSSRAALVR